ncbi:hypothetical protein VEIDISOL_00130 [Veillonella dispar ATCC 17748]|uniref:Uncharacterized protein n=1 Tax=Veillonella dispar ATCC 17748 TaxID=546273 RepID=C4FMX5_9FIRM|nr:hypothetical protein VEIDISOL_00130 [Veillonella dispar ATCC 17748]
MYLVKAASVTVYANGYTRHIKSLYRIGNSFMVKAFSSISALC